VQIPAAAYVIRRTSELLPHGLLQTDLDLAHQLWDVITNPEGFGKWSKLSGNSVCSAWPISADMYNISQWCSTIIVSYHLKCRSWPGGGQNNTAFWGWGTSGNIHELLSSLCSGASFDTLSSSGSGNSICELINIGRNISLSHQNIGECTQVSSDHSSYLGHETSFRSSSYPKMNEMHRSHHLCTLHAPDARQGVYIPTQVCSWACSFHSIQDQQSLHSPLVSQ
jgi:hypothetical protein